MGMAMGAGLASGAVLRSELSGSSYSVERLLGEGGQGQVWRVAAESGAAYALKWYFPHAATDDQYRALDALVRSGPPDGRFLWPLELIKDERTFGYVMELRRDSFRGMAELMRRTIDPTFRALATAGFELADSFLQLHAKGLCYIDISFGNVFLDPGRGGVLVCDNDNVRVNGTPAPVAGTPKFMAPEVIRALADGENPRPDRSTDLFSLSVLLFYMLVMHHPFEGRREADIPVLDAEAQNRLYGIDPLFIFHPDDTSNRPDPAHHPNATTFWPLYPGFVRDLFVRSFTAGIDDPEHGRVQESEWRLAMVRLRDAIVECRACGVENFADPDGAAAACWNCTAPMGDPARLEFPDRGLVALNRGTLLYPHHTRRSLYDFGAPQAEVVGHPDNPNVHGIKNLSNDAWRAITPDGERWEVPPGRSVTVQTGTRIRFAGAEAVIAGDHVGGSRA